MLDGLSRPKGQKRRFCGWMAVGLRRGFKESGLDTGGVRASRVPAFGHGWHEVRMGRKRLLTYSSDGRWRKQIDGRMYYFGRGQSVNDTRSYREAERSYLEFAQRYERTRTTTRPISQATVEDAVEKYMQGLEARYAADDLSATHVRKIQDALSVFCAAVGAKERFCGLTELQLEDYKQAMLRLPKSKHTGRPISPSTAKGRLDAVKSLYRWAYKMHIIEAEPRNMLDYARVTLPPPKVAVFTVEEIRRLWAGADLRMKAWMSLALNTGAGQVDISELRVRDVSLESRVLDRPRIKTGVRGRHRLWPLTVELLGAHRRPDVRPDDRWFHNCDGLPLTWTKMVEGKYIHSDAIKNAFWRLMRDAKIPAGRGFYSLRKTAASEIERIDPLVTSMFLSHSVRDMKSHYALRNWDALDRATDLLERVFGLTLGREAEAA